MSYRLGVDVGGTFTDLVLVSPDGVARTCEFEIGGSMSQGTRLNKMPDPPC
jgi:N-methylhydantoinase A/oxoprolinase/acetone carboxylase beta subunit